MTTITEIQNQAAEDGVKTEFLDSQNAIQEYEPHASGEAALFCPEVLSVDSWKYVYSLGGDAENETVDFFTDYEVEMVRNTSDMYDIYTSNGTITSSYLETTAGLCADKLAYQIDVETKHQIISFRGENHELVPEKRHLV